MIFLPTKMGGESPLFFSYKKALKLNKNLFENVVYFSSARNAISEIVKYENVSEIFIPEYYCYPIYIFLKEKKDIRIYKYSSNAVLTKKLKNSNSKKKLIILLLFNGMNISLKEYKSIEKYNIPNAITLIDSAMTPYISNVNFECDYVISNPRKFYKIPMGTFVFLKKCSNLKNNYGFNVFATINYLFPKLIGRILLASRIGIIEKLGLKFNKYSEENVPIKTDFLSLFLIKRFAIFDLSFERINQYNLYYEFLKPLKKYFYFQKKASKNDCPFGFILKYKYRDKLNKFLNSNRVFPSFLWDVPNSLKEEIELKTLIQSKEILVLPIGSQYCEKDIRNICDILLKFFKS